MEDLGSLIEAMSSQDVTKHELEEAELSRIVSLWDGMHFDEAGAQASALFRQGVHDIRLVVYSLHTHFVQGGPEQLEAVFSTLDQLLRDHLSELAPTRLRDAHFDKRLSWLFRTIAENLRCHGTAQELGRDWPRGLSEASFGALHAKVDALRALLEQLALRDAQTALAMCWIELERLPRRAPVEERPAVSPEPVQAAAPQPTAAMPAPSEAAVVPTDLERLTPPERVVSLVASSEFLVLCSKLSGFRRLVERRDFKRAAVVADDLTALIASFDPVRFFPQLFLGFTQQLSAHMDQIAPCMQERDSFEWNVLRQLYRAAPGAFAGE